MYSLTTCSKQCKLCNYVKLKKSISLWVCLSIMLPVMPIMSIMPIMLFLFFA